MAFVCKFGVFFYPHIPLCADVIYGSPQSAPFVRTEQSVETKWRHLYNCGLCIHAYAAGKMRTGCGMPLDLDLVIDLDHSS